MTQFTVNDAQVQVSSEPMDRLLDVLREELRLTGAKEGCGEGECGACTVLIDGVPINSCLVPMCQVEGTQIMTVEGLAKDGRLAQVQQAFLDYGAAQCGICTPGFLMTAHAFLQENPRPTRLEVREGLAGNLCRCTGYQKIIDAVQAALSDRGRT